MAEPGQTTSKPSKRKVKKDSVSNGKPTSQPAAAIPQQAKENSSSSPKANGSDDPYESPHIRELQK